MIRTYYPLILYIILMFCGTGLIATPADAGEVGEWRAYGSDNASTKYIPLDQINKNNVKDLQIAWRWNSPDNALVESNPDLWTMVNESTPLMIGGVIYTSTSLNLVAAINAVTGETIWVYDPKTYEDGTPANTGFVHRGVSYWEEGGDKRVLLGTGDGYLIALNAETGEPIQEFGKNGRVDLTKGLRRPVNRRLYAVFSPPMICRDVVVVGSTVLDSFAIGKPPQKLMPPGDVRGFDVRTGEQRWIFHTIPQDGEFGNETWKNDSWKTTGNTNVWTMMSADEELGYVYLPVSTPTNDYYGGHRLGDNLFADSLVCLNAETGERVWHFQILHHGLWDYDPPAAPNLIDITVDGKEIKAVAQVTKQAFCFVFDRETGEPVWPIEERPVPQSTVPGESSSPTQPFPTKPAPFDRQGLTHDDLIDFTPALRKQALSIIEDYDYGTLYTPPTEKGIIAMPGIIGGASWAGAAVDPDKGIIYIPSITFPTNTTINKAKDPKADYTHTGALAFGPKGPRGLPLMKPPYGRITAIDLNTGEHKWMQPVGDGPRDHPTLRHLDLPPLGWAQRNFPLLTQSLLFAASQASWDGTGNSPRGNAIEVSFEVQNPFLWAFDPDNGQLISRTELPSNAQGAPISYMANGKQFIVIPIGGANQPAELIALSLP